MADQKTLSIENLVEAISENNTKMKIWVTTQINNVKVISILWVDELPTTNISTSTIYLVKNEKNSKDTNNIYNEYIYKDDIGWEILGQVDAGSVDLSNYYTRAEINTILEQYIKQDQIHKHENKDILDKLSESADGNLLFNGQKIKDGSDSDITISKEDNNAIQQKDDGIFVEDKTEQINNIQSKLDNINIVQNNTKEKAFEEDILWEGSCNTNQSIKNINLSKSYQDYDELIFYLDCNYSNVFRPLYRIISPTLINKIRNSSISNSTVSMVWGYYNYEDYCDILKTSIDTRLDITSYNMTLVKIVGRKYNQIVIDPVEYINTSQGIEDTPVGHIISYIGNTAPKHYLICDGTEYNITDYPYLAQHFKDEFGSYNYFGGDGTTTFAVPDLRGEFLRGTGTNSHTNQGSGVNVGEHQDGSIIPRVRYNDGKIQMDVASSANLLDIVNADKEFKVNGRKWVQANTNNGSDTHEVTSSYTTRPTNTSVLYCIKYEPTYYMNVTQTISLEEANELKEQNQLLKKQNQLLQQEIEALNIIIDSNKTTI